jgi:arylsulfate sulfotransferase
MLFGCSGAVTAVAPPYVPAPSSPPPQPTQAGSVFVSPQYAAVGPKKTVTFSAQSTVPGNIEWLVNQVPGGNADVGTIDANGAYTAPLLSLSTNVVITAALTDSPRTNYATATLALIMPGHLTITPNPQVVAYSIYLPAPGSATIEFGPSGATGLSTSSQPTPSPNGGMVQIYVAGMRAATSYHMHAVVNLANGVDFSDSDHVFESGAPAQTASVVVSTESGGAPQDGVELFDTVTPAQPAEAFVTDLQGKVIWTYSFAGSVLDAPQPIKFLPNGHFLVLISFLSSLPAKIANNLPSGTIDAVREVDLAGNTVRELTLQSLAASLAAQGYNFKLKGLHHDVLPLPNGHLVLLANLTESLTNLPGYAGTTNVLGDILVDVDENFHPDWVWNSFDHLDVKRHPLLFPDWTHGNALLYSADDHNLLFSMRHQNWIVKIDFEDGKGSGNIIWRLGPGGDFKLVGGIDPTDWFYAQHGPSFFTPNTTGVFQLGLMDNGNDRQFPSGITCGTAGEPACHYSTVPVFQIDETAMTATLLSHYTPPPNLYSYFGGDVELLPNGHIQADFCAPTSGSIVQELDQSSGTSQVVWQAATPGFDQYRVTRLPSLYPGVQWPAVP